VAAGVLRLESGTFGLLRAVSGAEVTEVVERLAAVAGVRR
jgi:hypothetical protein